MSQDEYKRLNKCKGPRFYTCEICDTVLHPSEQAKHEETCNCKCVFCDILLKPSQRAEHEASPTHKKIVQMENELQGLYNQRLFSRYQRKKYKNSYYINCPCSAKPIVIGYYKAHRQTRKHQMMEKAMKRSVDTENVQIPHEVIKPEQIKKGDKGQGQIFWCGICCRNIKLSMKDVHMKSQEHQLHKARYLLKEKPISCYLDLSEFND
jgi:hypothetical protein